MRSGEPRWEVLHMPGGGRARGREKVPWARVETGATWEDVEDTWEAWGWGKERGLRDWLRGHPAHVTRADPPGGPTHAVEFTAARGGSHFRGHGLEDAD